MSSLEVVSRILLLPNIAIFPVRLMHRMYCTRCIDAGCRCLYVAWSVCQSVCLLVCLCFCMWFTTVNPVKTVERIYMPFATGQTLVHRLQETIHILDRNNAH